MNYFDFNEIEYQATDDRKVLIIRNLGKEIEGSPFDLESAYGVSLKIIKRKGKLQIWARKPEKTFPKLAYRLNMEFIEDNDNKKNMIFGNCFFDKGETSSNINIQHSEDKEESTKVTIGQDGLMHMLIIGTDDLRDARSANKLQHLYLVEPSEDNPYEGYHLNLKVDGEGGSYDLLLRYSTFTIGG